MPKADQTFTASRRAFASGALALLGTAAAAIPAAAAEQPDEDLIRICAEHIGHRQAYDGARESAENFDALLEAYEDSRDAISEAEPQTIAGILAKCRAAKDSATTCGDEEKWRGTMGELWAQDIVNDLLRLVADSARS